MSLKDYANRYQVFKAMPDYVGTLHTIQEIPIE